MPHLYIRLNERNPLKFLSNTFPKFQTLYQKLNSSVLSCLDTLERLEDIPLLLSRRYNSGHINRYGKQFPAPAPRVCASHPDFTPRNLVTPSLVSYSI